MKKTLTLNTVIKQTNLIKSAEGVKTIQTQIASTRDGQYFPAFDITETSTDTIWTVECIGNGNPWDCWITKKGTLGNQRRTFKRLYVQPGKEDFKIN